jgi:hypothetical protein
MKLIASLVLAVAILVPVTARAEIAQCKGLTLKSVVVESTREDNHFFASKLILTLNGECGGKGYAHLELNDPAFNGILTIALAAKAANKPVNIAVNKSKATQLSFQIAYLELE